MNLIRQREVFRRMHVEDFISEQELRCAYRAPLFQFEATDVEIPAAPSARELDLYFEVIGPIGSALHPRIKPFNSFLVSSKLRTDLWLSKYRGCWSLVSWINTADKTIPLWARCDFGTSMQQMGSMVLWSEGEPVVSEFPDFSVDSLREDYLGLLRLFLFSINRSGAVVVKVSPPADDSRSVEWRLSREHYLVLLRKDVIELQRTRGAPTSEHIRRSAHDRREHLRELRSEKFTHQRGTRVHVKSTWVGPREWEGTDRKIYRVVDFTAPQA
jgi:hypothetical protein